MSLSYLRWQILSGSRLCYQKHLLIETSVLKLIFKRTASFFTSNIRKNLFNFLISKNVRKRGKFFSNLNFAKNSSKLTKFRIYANMENGIFVSILQGSYWKNPIRKIQNLWGILSAFYCTTYLNSLHELLQLTAASSGCLRHVLLYLPTKRIVNIDFQLFVCKLSISFLSDVC